MKWTKPNGTEIETVDNDETIAYCKSLGWEEVTDKPRPRGRPRKVVDDDDSD